MKQYNVIIPAQHRFPHYQAVNVAPRGLKASELGVASILFAVSFEVEVSYEVDGNGTLIFQSNNPTTNTFSGDLKR